MTDTKLDAQRIGPYKVITPHDNQRTPNVTLQFAGIQGTEIVVHQDDLLLWPGINDEEVKGENFPAL